MSTGISKRAIDAWYDQAAERGVRLTCIANEVWSPERFAERLLGQEFEYVKGKNSIQIRRLGSSGDGENFWLNRPKRVSDVVALSEDEITYVIRDGLTSTWRLLFTPARAARGEGEPT